MNVAVRVAPTEGTPAAVEYRWDVDTDILTAHIAASDAGEGLSGSVEIEGRDGSWLILDVRRGQLAGVEVAVWPDVRIAGALTPPASVVNARVSIPARPLQPGTVSVEVDTQLTAEADQAERTVHFRIGGARTAQTVRAAQDLLLELDKEQHIVGVWMLNVPPFPGES